MCKIGIIEGSYEWALMMLKNGCRMQRQVWNGKDMFLYLTSGQMLKRENIKPETHYYLYGNSNKNEDGYIKINSHIDMKTADGSITIGWIPSQVDMLSNDWIIYKI